MKKGKRRKVQKALHFIALLITIVILMSPGTSLPAEIPAALETIVAEDGSVWERVNAPGFGDHNNTGIVALTQFGVNLFALTRNDVTGFELWKTSGTGWVQVTVPGFTDSNNVFGFHKLWPGTQPDATLYNLMQNIWGDMIVFNGDLYVAVSSGYQGSRLYGSLGVEIWRFDGSIWQPVISQAVDSDESGTITALSGCDDGDAGFTAYITDSGKSWAQDQWAGCVLRVNAAFDGSDGTLAGIPSIRLLQVLSNTTDTLTVQENENGGEDEYTVCDQHIRPGDAGRAFHFVPGITAGSAYTLACGMDEQGFGEIWNKSIVDLEILQNELYATIGLNYDDGARILKTSDGSNWIAASDYSMGLFHGFDPSGNPTDFCLVSGQEGRNGFPVSSSFTNFGKSDVTGALTLFTGGTGTSGCNGRGARVYRLDGDQWTGLVDYFVDTNDTGTNENGFGDSDDFASSNFQAWSWAEYDNLLFASIVRLQGGGRIMYSGSGSAADGAWVYAVGGDAAIADGFGEATNIGSHLYVFNNQLFAGTISNIGFNPGPTNGADLWKGTGPGAGLTWTRVTGDGFGDTNMQQFEAFTAFAGNLYVAGSNLTASGLRGEEPAGYSGAKIFRLNEQLSLIREPLLALSLADISRDANNPTPITLGMGDAIIWQNQRDLSYVYINFRVAGGCGFWGSDTLLTGPANRWGGWSWYPADDLSPDVTYEFRIRLQDGEGGSQAIYDGYFVRPTLP